MSFLKKALDAGFLEKSQPKTFFIGFTFKARLKTF
jgi:hypothetical protein